jgi:hypothetical protein
MGSLEKARETQLRNIESKTGKTLAELKILIAESGLARHSEIRDMLRERFGLGFGDAAMLVHFAQESDGQTRAEAQGLSNDAVVDELYSGSKSSLRPLHDRVMQEVEKLGEYEIAPKKGYLSLRRKRQFAMIGPGTKGRLQIGLNLKERLGTERFIAQPAGGMCQIIIHLTTLDEVDEELVDWIQAAFEAAG